MTLPSSYPYPFFAFCSDVLNNPAVFNLYKDTNSRLLLMNAYGLTQSQKDAVHPTRNIPKIIAELQKELNNAQSSQFPENNALIYW